MSIRVARRNGRPVGSVVTLRHGHTLVYKYGCSDAGFHNLGTMPFLFWRTIQDAKAQGLHTLDLGRSDTGNRGLVTFKDRLGAARSVLTYRRFSTRDGRATGLGIRVPPAVLARMPDSVLVAAGRLLYRHIC